ncbi:blue copper protein 1a-like [Cornus florida]|uniref:blue copper protein 1a-like n=1 Tax=Cornus florida TaxID=4283 RepID=UPI002897D457|nr:blue copper protein 1a-like [Cornus florida]
MARLNVLAIALLAALIPIATLAKEIVVGDDAGWITKFDYVSWAKKQDFQVGDTLVFKYPQGAHNVIKVDENAYKNCAIPPAGPANPVLASGKDVISLDAPGKKWFLCAIPGHCEKGGQKLEIEVKAGGGKTAAAPTATPTAAPKLAPAPTDAKSDNKTAATSPAAATPSGDGAPAPAPASSANGLNGYQLPLAIVGAIAALAIF